MSYKILTLNNISVAGLDHFPRDRYEIASEIGHPDAILVRSHKMHDMEIPASVLAIGRAGVGVNNIPVEAMSHRGVPVFNAPGANANAVKELVLAGMLLAARNLCQAWDLVRELEDSDGLDAQVEAAKKRYAGFELPGRTLGVLGLGAIGVEVANAALGLGMKVVDFDPQITVDRARQLSPGAQQAASLGDLFRRSDIVTLHVPLVPETRGMVNAERIGMMKKDAVLLNFARGGIVDEDAVLQALDEGKLHTYVCDFPSAHLKNHPRVIALPHLGASTKEAEDNCAAMVVENVMDYLENGNVRHSVNFPEAVMPRNGGCRLSIANANVPNMVGQISTSLADASLNIADLLNKSRGELAYTLVDLDAEVPAKTVEEIRAIEGVLSVRSI